MKTFEVALITFIVFVAFLFGLFIGLTNYNLEHEAKIDLTAKVQDCIAERNGFEQLYNTANKGICTREGAIEARLPLIAER